MHINTVRMRTNTRVAISTTRITHMAVTGNGERGELWRVAT